MTAHIPELSFIDRTGIQVIFKSIASGSYGFISPEELGVLAALQRGMPESTRLAVHAAASAIPRLSFDRVDLPHLNLELPQRVNVRLLSENNLPARHFSRS